MKNIMSKRSWNWLDRMSNDMLGIEREQQYEPCQPHMEPVPVELVKVTAQGNRLVRPVVYNQ